MSASLVGSEMCIRDSRMGQHGCTNMLEAVSPPIRYRSGRRPMRIGRPVSYTHLTLPTICSV
eukprot:2078040-Alexandrium_andersonii.AAC.1